MKKTVVFLVSVFLLLSVLSSASTVFATDLSDNIVLQLTETHTDNEIVINVNLVTNTGISAMTLELVFDNTAFEFQGYQQGTALGKLDLISTDLSGDPTLPVKFNWFNQNPEVDNDFSTGHLLQLHFALKPDSRSGEYEIGFKYDPESDIVYNNVNTKSAAIGKAVVNIETNQIREIEIQNAKTTSGRATVFLIVGISVAVAAALGAVITVLVIRTRKKKGKKENWLKL